ncbi:MAG TPA: OsmC family protein [Bacteroidales bacterium]|jgi:uncharacterized OsmC-like protein|nr:OsmC family protein [Bacteroidales bacterium]MDI9574721.1 OsmC family protein [Bacteroidota bacterium]MBP9510962.1 OsmC family protein [Bacteroidales bacterium]MBP9587920.1 OsmC family protein [Bacteroidales bacterium]NMD16773.1 OsmC family protein [Bacteroidales bacterium]
MATIETIYLGELRTKATHLQSGSSIITDAPLDNQGRGEAFSPTDLLAAALASCMLTIMGIAARTHGFNLDGTKAEITKIMESNPRRVGEIIIHLYFPPHPFTEKEKQIIRNSAFTCPVYQSLNEQLKKTVHFHF